MSATIVSLHSQADDGSGRFAESLLDFIAREKLVTTYAVSTRFGGDVREAKRQLDKLRKSGLIEAERAVIEWGAINAWRITEAGRAALEQQQQKGEKL